jgi:AraC-like DNA-binding protein
MRASLEQLLTVERLTLREAGERLGCSATHVYRLAKRLGVTDRRRHSARHRRDEIHQMRSEGLQYREIAARVGCAVRTVQSIVRDYERHRIAEELGLDDSGPFTRQHWGELANNCEEPLEVKPYRCPKHGLMRLRPCVACLAEGVGTSAESR